MRGKEATQQDRSSETFEKWVLAAGSKLLLQEKPSAAFCTEKEEQEKLWGKQVWGSRNVGVNKGAVKFLQRRRSSKNSTKRKNIK